MRNEDLLGKRFGRLVVKSKGVTISKHGQWYCECDCGKQVLVWTTNLTSGRTQSCGCGGDVVKKVERHGHTNSPTYASWKAMKDRCLNPNDDAWENYGARGILICERWKDSFSNFLADMGERPEGKTLDRKDHEGPYCKENCTWSDSKVQNWNKRSKNVVIMQKILKPNK